MNWEDTVMDTNITCDAIGHCHRCQLRIGQEQAEISFKAGRESILAEVKAGTISVYDLILAAKQDCRKEVVEKITPILIDSNTSMGRKLILITDAVAILKEMAKEE